LKFYKITYFYIYALFLSGLINLNAQEVFRGNFQLTDTIAGQAEYSFVRKNNTNVFEGHFKFNYSKRFEDVFKSLSYQGEFNNNQKSGQWIFSLKNLSKSDSLNISDYQISYTASGFEYWVEGIFNNGKATGNWLVVEQNFKNAIPADSIFSSSVTFDNGKMTQQLKAKSPQMRLDGLFDDVGMADGKWVIIHNLEDKIIEEQRVYENGIFKNHFFKYEGEIHEIVHFGLDTAKDEGEANWEIIDIRNQYFNIFELSNIGFISDVKIIETSEVKQLTEKANDFIEKAITSFAYKNDFNIWNNITKEQELEFGKFKVRKYPFSDEESKRISEIKSYNEKIAQIINQFFSNPQIEIGRLNYESLNRYYAILEVYKKNISQIDNLANKIINPSIEYLDRSIFVKSFAPNLNLGNEIKFEFNDDTYSESYDFPKVPIPDNFNIETANTFFKLIHNDVSAVFKEASVVLNDLQKMEDLSDLEVSLVEKRSQIQNRFNNTENDESYNNFHKDVQEVVQNFAEQHFKSYAALSLDEKKQQIDNYLVCFDQILELYDFLADLKLKVDRLDETYIRTSFNPYLMVDMDERVKERLYNAYQDIVLPYLFEKMKNEFDCKNINSNTDNIKNLINRMSQFRDEDTSAKERQLRRVKDALEVLFIMELDIN